MCMMRSYMNIRDYLVILIPSRDGRAFVDTVAALCLAAASLKKEPLIVCCDGLTYWDARNNVIAKLARHLKNFNIKHENIIRALWVDNDILIQESVDMLTMHIVWADTNDCNIVANYKTTWGPGQVANTIMFSNQDGTGTYRNVTDEELEGLSDRTPQIGMVGGLGFYYGNVPLDYEYRIYPPYMTEDICFYCDNKVYLTYLPIKLLHSKQVFL